MVRRLTSPRLEFEAAAIYEYPEHLRSFLNDLPTRPGVYLFHGESDTMPLYIGKSVNIRSRVLSHLRTPDEAAMLRQSRRISWICTAGEIGALLLEARLIKEQQPLFNKRLRRNRQLCALQLNEKRVDDFATDSPTFYAYQSIPYSLPARSFHCYRSGNRGWLSATRVIYVSGDQAFFTTV